MCKKNNLRVIDKCMRNVVKLIDSHPNIEVLACCCGHGRYNQSIVVRAKYQYDSDVEYKISDLVSGALIPRKTKFYKLDEEGFFFIPESKGRFK